MNRSRRYSGLFWPAVLILAGVIALLVNTGRLSGDRLGLLLDLWPVILIVIGLEIVIRSAMRGAAADVAGALVVLLAVVGAVAYVATGPSHAASTQALDLTDTKGDLSRVSLEIDAGAATINVSTDSSLETDLYHVHIDYSGSRPSVNLDRSAGRLTIMQSNEGFSFFGSRHIAIDLKLNPQVRWSITENTGASTDTENLSALNLSSLTVNTGASREEITLSTPSGTVPVTINGGALTVHVHRPGAAPASIHVSGGALNLDADGHRSGAIGRVDYSSPDYDGASNRYDITVDGGACTVTLDAPS